ncbi:MAG: alpha-amylase family glycosyl hydrolase [Lachnotalea sp.]
MTTYSNETINLKVNNGITTALGVTMWKDGINFAVAVSEEKACRLLLYPYGGAQAIVTVDFKEEEKSGDIYTAFIQNLSPGRYEYRYEIDQKPYVDPYARSVTGREVWGIANEQSNLRASFDLQDYEWEKDRPLEIPYEEIIMYSLHVRGFTKHPSSKAKNKGTFEGLIEKIPYLKELGINQIELMPAYEFDEIIPRQDNSMEFKQFESDKQYSINYWGYAKANYFAPKASYCAGDNCIVSFKNMVKELHKNKIEVIMEFNFQSYVNQNLILDCIHFWVEEYHIDGVHISSDNTPLTAIATSPRLSHTKIMALGFEVDKIYYEDSLPKMKHLAEYHDGFLVDVRQFLKGDSEQLDDVTYRIRRNPDRCGVINYIANHNGFNLVDMVSYEEKHNEANGENNKDGNNCNYSWNSGIEGPTRKKAIIELRKKQMKNALTTVLLSQGVPLIFSGDELGNSQKGNNNPYCQDNEISWMDWSKEKSNKDILDFTKGLLEFRKEHNILHYKKELKIMDYLSCGYPDLSYHGQKAWYPEFENNNSQMGIMYCGKYALNEKGKEDDFIYIAYNMHDRNQEFVLPNLPKDKKWRLLLDTSMKEEDTQVKIRKKITVSGRSIMVVIGK